MVEDDFWHKAPGDCGHGLYELGKVPLHAAGTLEHWCPASLYQLQPDREAIGTLYTGLIRSISASRPKCRK